MIVERYKLVFLTVCFCLTPVVQAGPYTEAGINGFIDSDWRHADPDARINPIFRGWATGVESYDPASPWDIDFLWMFPETALGPVTGNYPEWDVVSLGDLDQQQIGQGVEPGSITLSFSEPEYIRNVKGYDFVVFENGHIASTNTDYGSIAGQMFSELGYVEVSSDGITFARFPAVSLAPEPTAAPYHLLTIEISDMYNFAGKHPNAYGTCTGTGFDLSELADDPLVISGAVDVNSIRYVRIIDVPGSGDFFDEAQMHIDPNTGLAWDYYESAHPIYDAWLTSYSGGFDLEAIGVLKEQQFSADINLDGIVDICDLNLFCSAWMSSFGDENWIARCDLVEPKDLVIDMRDFAAFARQWRKIENWRDQ